MKYEPPYGVADPNASYINGNPSTGTMGSIPPAASIENPQREIVNFIGASGLTPTDADLVQLAKAVQNGAVNFGADQGTPNQIAITLNPAIAAYTVGLRIFVKMAYANTTQVVVNVNAIGSVPLVHTDLTPLVGAELKAGQMLEAIFDGTNFQLLSGGSGGGYIYMTAPRSVYVNAATGSDTAYDGSQAAVAAPHGPFQTIQRALTEMAKYNLGGWNFTIYIADGLYNITSEIFMPQPNGSGTVVLQGDHANPQNVEVFNTNIGACFIFRGGSWLIDGLSFRSTAPGGNSDGSCILVEPGSSIQTLALAFGPTPGSDFWVNGSCSVTAAGAFTIWGTPQAGHLNIGANATWTNFQGAPGPPTLNITVPISCPNFVSVYGNGYASLVYGSITGAGNVTAQKFIAFGNGVLDLGGRGASYLPGSSAGVLATGGQLI